MFLGSLWQSSPTIIDDCLFLLLSSFHFRGSKVIEDLVKVIGHKDSAKMGPHTSIQIGTEVGLGTSLAPGTGHLLETQATSTSLPPQELMELVLGQRLVHQHRHMWAHSAKKLRPCRSGNLGQANLRWPVLEDHELQNWITGL